MLGKDEKQTFVSIDFMTQKSSKHPSTSLDQNEHAFNFVGDVTLWLRFRPAGLETDDSTSSCNQLCVDSGLASFCAFSRVFTPEGRLCRSQAPWYSRSVACIPSWDKIPLLSFVESAGAARMPGCNPAPRGRTARRPRRPRFPHARPAASRAGRRAAR